MGKRLSKSDRQFIISAKLAGHAWSDIEAALVENGCTAGRETIRGVWRSSDEKKLNDSIDRIQEKQDGENRREVSMASSRITTVEDLVQFAQVDLTTWYIERHEINKWEVGAKSVERDLTYVDGRATGTIRSDGGLRVAPLIQIKLWLRRIKPVPVFPTIQPVFCTENFEMPEVVREAVQRSVILADPHIGFTRDLRTAELEPFHDRRAMDVALQVIQYVSPTRIDILGDFLDLADWSDKFTRLPEFVQLTQPAVLEGYWWLRQIRKVAPNAVITLYEGNHDERMRRAVLNNMRQAYELRAADEMDLPPALSVPKLLALHELGIRWIGNYPDGEDWLNGNVRLLHGNTAQVPGNTAKAVVSKADTTEIFGHIHRTEWCSRTQHLRDRIEVIEGFCPGCLCRIDGVVPGVKEKQQWGQGIAVVDYTEDRHNIAPVLISDGRALWDGMLFGGEDRTADVQQAYPDWNWG